MLIYVHLTGELLRRGHQQVPVAVRQSAQSIKQSGHPCQQRWALGPAAEEELKRFQNAIKAGVDPAALVEAVNEAQAKRAVAQAELVDVPTAGGFESADLYAMVDNLGDVGVRLGEAKPESLSDLCRRLDLQVSYSHTSREADVSINLATCVDNAYVRGGT
ncbi:hypothetical protein [Lentzea sp. NEAU-D7]|uniref:hypothetical protein n=1 Tax=Lentzea sp. NEAU-D7 TaxID=2994667 RepID=UPI00224B8323|nr:hypothetical protein [Lentzea sp. NEAU-D7]MCX2950163.1 hypothetical protein [Lentzea sp. NEAU-D7]